ncbi:MAG: two-component system response regulator [Candidatus Riflebacteria bacterium HGW-Riflebacteria-1]|jgi:DNA-binding NtrC family response regulator|nr:MAG: two-component system response regulator [Candidatus Riflebacteria bacterium HGW-Riflebacteria-1]
MTGKAKILVIDDEHSVRWAFEKALQKAGYQVALAENGVKGLNLYKTFHPDIVLVDIRMPEMDGLTVLEHIRELDSEAQVIVMTAYTDMETTISAMKLGAYDFLSKPFNIDECLLLISRGLSARNTGRAAEVSAQAPKSSGLKGNSPAMQEVYKLIGKVSEEDVTVLVTGESGSGKELVAQAIHYNSRRSQKPFWAINCTAINESLMESELFGYEKGAFTGAAAAKPGMFELAQGGTIFLDEIGDMNLEMQAKLLRVLEEREIVRVGGNKRISVDVRIIAATNRDLRRTILEGRFREDLYHRIKVIEIKLPSLRERPEDIPLLARYFCSILAAQRRGAPKTLSEETIAVLSAYAWPGNVRELRNAVEQSYTLSRDQMILPEHLPVEVRLGNQAKVKRDEELAGSSEMVQAQIADSPLPAAESAAAEIVGEVKNDAAVPVEVSDISSMVKALLRDSRTGEAYSYVMEKFERELLRQSLEMHRWNQVQSAAHLGITRNTLRAKIDKYEL